jgi:hypothetical protein
MDVGPGVAMCEAQGSRLVRKRVPLNEGELVEAVAEVTGNQFVGPGMRPGDVRRHIKKADPDEE